MYIIRCPGVGFKGFEVMGVVRFVRLLNNLCADAEEGDVPEGWGSVLLDAVQNPEGRQHLTLRSWELLAEISTSPPWFSLSTPYASQVSDSLSKDQEWDKFECWMVILMMQCIRGYYGTEGDLEYGMKLLFRQRPGAAQKLTQWMEERSKGFGVGVPQSFKKSHKAAL